MKKYIIVVILVFTQTIFAQLDREETTQALKENTKVKCSFSLRYFLQTKDGYSALEKAPEKKVLIANKSVEASSSSDFATYSLEWEDEGFKFYYAMNSQVGTIRITDKESQLTAESDLDIYDMIKEPSFIGSATLKKVEDLEVTSVQGGAKVPGEKITYLKGICHKLQNYIP